LSLNQDDKKKRGKSWKEIKKGKTVEGYNRLEPFHLNKMKIMPEEAASLHTVYKNILPFSSGQF
jgi:hypothetical protein